MNEFLDEKKNCEYEYDFLRKFLRKKKLDKSFVIEIIEKGLTDEIIE